MGQDKIEQRNAIADYKYRKLYPRLDKARLTYFISTLLSVAYPGILVLTNHVMPSDTVSDVLKYGAEALPLITAGAGFVSARRTKQAISGATERIHELNYGNPFLGYHSDHHHLNS